MVTIVRGSVPADEFALNHSLTSIPDLVVEVERIVETGDEAVMPLLWVRGGERSEIEAAFDDDPTVDEVELVAAVEDEYMYKMQWVDHIDLILQMLTNAEATILDAYGHGDTWTLRMMYPKRDKLSAIHDFCNGHGLSFEVESVRDMEGNPAGRFGLTDEQFEALTTGARRGLFTVPRESTIEELAAELDISHQALSERIRRGTEALIEDTLLVGAPDASDDDESEDERTERSNRASSAE